LNTSWKRTRAVFTLKKPVNKLLTGSKMKFFVLSSSVNRSSLNVEASAFRRFWLSRTTGKRRAHAVIVIPIMIGLLGRLCLGSRLKLIWVGTL
jgi:hypothetical protein